MCKGKQELELLGKHDRGCCMALTWSLPQPSGWIHGHKNLLKLAPSGLFLPRGLTGSSGAQQDPKEMGDTQSAPGLLQGRAAHWHHGHSRRLCWGMRQLWIFSFWDGFWGIANSPSLGRNAAGSVISPLVPILWGIRTVLDPSGLSVFSLLLQLSFSFVPLDYKSQTTLLCEKFMPGHVPSLSTPRTRKDCFNWIYDSVGIYFPANVVFIAMIIDSCTYQFCWGKTTFLNSFSFGACGIKINSGKNGDICIALGSPAL